MELQGEATAAGQNKVALFEVKFLKSEIQGLCQKNRLDRAKERIDAWGD